VSGGLPSLYGGWLTELLAGPIPDETAATCETCAMCGTGGGSSQSFRPDLKCCTYVPELPNFTVGRILSAAQSDGHGRATVVDRIRSGVCVTPLGLGRPPALERRYLDRTSERFGHDSELRCPHYDVATGGCGIWRNRTAVCATWFCKHSRGAVVLHFWELARDLLRVVEKELAHWCIAGAELDDRGGWGAWLGREEEFYVECGRLAGEQTWSSVLARSGSELRALARQLQHAFQQLMSFEVPERLERKPATVFHRAPDGRVTVSTYSGLDPLSLPPALFNALGYFDGRPTDDALDAIRSGERLRLSSRLVRKLVDFEILGPASR